MKYFKYYTLFLFLLYIFINPMRLYSDDDSEIFSKLLSSKSNDQKYALSYIHKNRPKEIYNRILTIIKKRKYNNNNKESIFNALKLYPQHDVINYSIEILDKSDSPTLLVDIIDFLSDYSDRRIVLPLAKHLKSPYRNVRKSAAIALKKNGDDRLYPIILSIATSSNPVHRIYFIEAMFYLYDRRFYSYLTDMLKDQNKSVRIYIINCLKKNQLNESLFLIRNIAVNDNNDEVRINAIEAIGEFRDAMSLYVLFKTINDKNRDVRCATAKSLYQIGSYTSVYPLSNRLMIEEDKEIKELLLDNLIKIKRIGDIRGVEKILLSDDDERLRIKAGYTLGVVRDQRAVQILQKGLNDSDYRVRGEVCNSLGSYKTKPVMFTLLGVVEKDESRYVKSAALYSIKRFYDKSAVLYLFDIYSKESDLIFKEVLRSVIRDFIKKYI